MNQPVILCGLGQVGRHVLDYLIAAGIPVVVIDDQCSPEVLSREKVRLIQGDFREKDVLQQVDLAGARGVLILTSDDLVNISAALMVRHLHAGVRIVVRLFNQNLIPRLGKAVANTFALSVSSLTAPLLALTALTGQALGAFSLDNDRYQISEFTIHERSSFRNHSVGEFAARHRVLVLGHDTQSAGMKFLHAVDGSARLAPGDLLVVCGEPRSVAPLLEEIDEEVLPHLRWANWLRRAGLMLGRTLSEIDLPVLLCSAVLFGVVLASTSVYLLGVGLPFSDAIFRTISVIATGADMHEAELVQPWQKVFVSALRILGAAIIAAFTAIVTNYLLRARLGGALEIRRIPDSGHVVVCGLGNIGFRVVEVLLQYGERVVVIETKRDSKFVAAARRLKVAIIIGDATVLEVLRQAHVLSARAVVAATNNELANLEIALLARELNPRQRVVVRLNDRLLSETLRQEANIRLALSIPTLAAPAFVAALFGDRVLSVFLVKGRIMAAIELLVQAGDSFLSGHAVRILAIDYRLMPVHLRSGDVVVPANILDHVLNPGDRLATITTLPDLNRFLRRERVPADCHVEVTQVPPLARNDMIQWLQQNKNWNAEEASKGVDQLPLSLGNNYTRGQAENLIALLRKEGVQAQIT